jgi:hypothetical protein
MSKITQIPLAGGSGQIPTGALQFKDDWPGLFLRGDFAISIMVSIQALQKPLADHSDPVVIAALFKLQEIADVIKNDVVV